MGETELYELDGKLDIYNQVNAKGNIITEAKTFNVN